MRRIANGEGNSQNATYLSNVPIVNRSLMDITDASPTCVLDFCQRKLIYNRNPYQRKTKRNITNQV